MTSQPHDDRVKALSEQANRLIQAGHYDSDRCVLGSRQGFVCEIRKWRLVLHMYVHRL